MSLQDWRRRMVGFVVVTCLALVMSGCVPPDPGNVQRTSSPGGTAGWGSPGSTTAWGSPGNTAVWASPGATAPVYGPPAEKSRMEKPLSETNQFPVKKTEDEWKALLSPEQYRITRLKGTERAFTGKYWNTKAPGTYQCVCCGQDLFVSDAKFDSGCGWPSFFQGIEGSIVTQPDNSIPPPRVEIMCSKCGAHLGHVFKDGPPPTGLRFCVNSASVKLIAIDAEKNNEQK